MIRDDIWDDQKEFNAQLRVLPRTHEERMQLTKEFTLHLMAECASVLDACGAWQMHRNHKTLENQEQLKHELIDVFKYWLSIVQAHGFTPSEMASAYWLKSASVRQHWAEEWMRDLNQPMVLLDLDNVLCDYVTGICDWLMACLREGRHTFLKAATVQELRRTRTLVNATSLNITETQWRNIKHQFRTNGAKRSLPAMPGASEFVEWCRIQGWAIVILTSRPLDTYPNLYTDTIDWLVQHHIDADYVWWGTNKADKIWEVMHRQDRVPNIAFAVDDDETFIAQYQRAGICAYWLVHDQAICESREDVRIVHKLSDIIRREGECPWGTKILGTDRTPTTGENPRTGTSRTAPKA